MRVAVCQLNARDDRAANLAVARTLLERSAAAGAEVAVLPEYTDYLGPADRAPKPEPVDGEYAAFFADAARELDIAVVAGSFHEVGPDAERTFNTSLVFDRDGTLAATYRKIHLYDVEIPGRVSYHESRTVASGTETVVVPIAGVPFGLSICYDLRFPELYRRLAVDGAQVLVVPAAFMLHTGRDHWEVLLRAQHGDRPLGDGPGAGTGHRGDRGSRPRLRAPGQDPCRAAEPGQPPAQPVKTHSWVSPTGRKPIRW